MYGQRVVVVYNPPELLESPLVVQRGLLCCVGMVVTSLPVFIVGTATVLLSCTMVVVVVIAVVVVVVLVAVVVIVLPWDPCSGRCESKRLILWMHLTAI